MFYWGLPRRLAMALLLCALILAVTTFLLRSTPI